MIYNPKHPGLLVKSICIDPLGISVTEAANYLKVARSTLSKLINGRMSISPEMAIRLSIVFKTESELWINLQAQYDLYLVEKRREEKRYIRVCLIESNEYGLMDRFHLNLWRKDY